MLGRRSVLGLLGLAPTMAPTLVSQMGNVVDTSSSVGYASPDTANYIKEVAPISEKEYLSNELSQFKRFLEDITKDENSVLQQMIALNTRLMMSYNQPQIDWDIRNMKSISDVAKIHMQAIRVSKRELEERKSGYVERIATISKQLMGL